MKSNKGIEAEKEKRQSESKRGEIEGSDRWRDRGRETEDRIRGER
jgi:hypothetical protein